MTTTAETANGVLTDSMLEQFQSRSATYDAENKFFQEDFDDLKAAGYLTLAVPSELGGGGLNLADMSKATRRLGKHAPATALALFTWLCWRLVLARETKFWSLL